MGGKSETKEIIVGEEKQGDGWFEDNVQFQDGSGLIFFNLPHDDAIETIRARSAVLSCLLTVETVFIFVDSVLGLPQDESGIDVIEERVKEIEGAKWDKALRVWALHFDHLEGEAASLSSLSSSSSFAPQFRCSCRRRGDQPWQSQTAAGSIGAGLVDRFPNWKVSLKRYELEVYGNINREHMILGISLSLRPTDGNSNAAGHPGGRKKRRRRKGFVTHLGKTALAPTIANSLILLADIKPGQVVIDPFCGVGTIPIHVAAIEPQAIVFGADRSTSEVHKTVNNLKLYLWDVRRLPLRSSIVDVVISDLPFGIRSGSAKANHVLYPLALKELARITKPLGKAILITADDDLMTEVVTTQVAHLWRPIQTQSFLMGTNEMRITLYVLKRRNQDEGPSPQSLIE